MSPDEVVVIELQEDAEGGLAPLFMSMSENEEEFNCAFTPSQLRRLKKKLNDAEFETDDIKSGARVALYRIITKAVAKINKLAQKSPELWREVAGLYPVWPVLLSEHPVHCRKARELVRLLDVGGKHPIRVDKSARTQLDDNPFNVVALQLLLYVETSVELAKLSSKPTSWRRKAAKPYNIRFSRDTWWRWWAVAREAFLAGYPYPEKIEELAVLVSKRPSQRHRVPSRILGELKEAFQRLASAPTASTK